MSGQAEAGFCQARLPTRSCADCGRVFEQSVAFFLLGQTLELGEQRMSRREERFLAVEDWWVVALAVVVEVELP